MKIYDEIQSYMENQWKESTGKKKEEPPQTAPEVRPQPLRTPSIYKDTHKKLLEKQSILYRTPGKTNVESP